MPIAAAVTFGSFRDIVTIIQLVAQLCAALSNVAGAPAEIDALAADLDGYMLVLAAAEDVLLRADCEAQFEPRTRAIIQGGLARCMGTLLAIQRHVDAFAGRVRPGHSLLSACAAARNGVLSERILVLVHTRPPQIAADASVLQVRNRDSDAVYAAFAAVPLHLISAYLAPLVKLLDPKRMSRELSTLLTAIARGPEGQLVHYDLSHHLTVPIFDCVFFSSGSGERHVALGVPPLLQNALVTRMLVDVLHGEFYANSDAGMYASEEQNARFLASVADKYNHVLELARCCSEHPQYRDIIRALERFPDLSSPTSMAVLARLERERFGGIYRADEQVLREVCDLVSGAPALAECSTYRHELQRLTSLPRIAGDTEHIYFPYNPAPLLFDALGKRPGNLRLSRASCCAVGHIGYDLPDPDAVPHLETLHLCMTASAVLVA